MNVTFFSILLVLLVIGVALALIVALGLFVARDHSGIPKRRSQQDTEDAELIRDLQRLVTDLERRIESLETLTLDEYNTRSRRRPHSGERE